MNESFDALNQTVRQSAEALRHLTLWCSLLAIRLGNGISDNAVQTIPKGLVPYRPQESSEN